MNPTNLPSVAIAVLERGFVYVGRISVADGFLTISDAQNVRRWGTSRGLGELADSGPLENTKLDKAPDIFVPVHALIHLIACNNEKWPMYA